MQLFLACVTMLAELALRCMFLENIEQPIYMSVHQHPGQTSVHTLQMPPMPVQHQLATHAISVNFVSI